MSFEFDPYRISDDAYTAPKQVPFDYSLFGVRLTRIGRVQLLAQISGALVVSSLAVVPIYIFVFFLGFPSHFLFVLVALLPSMGVIAYCTLAMSRRLYDLDRSHWWLFVVFIPPFCFLPFLLPGVEGDNRYGPTPDDPSRSDFVLAALLPLGVLSAGWVYGWYF